MAAENVADTIKHNAGRAKEIVGSAQDEADKEVSGPPQGTDHSEPAGDAAENAADSVPNQTDDGT